MKRLALLIAAAEARSETRLATALGEVRTEFAGLRGDIRELKAATASKSTVIGTGIALFLGLGAPFLAALSFGSQMFGQGFSASAIADQAAAKAVAAAQHRP